MSAGRAKSSRSDVYHSPPPVAACAQIRRADKAITRELMENLCKDMPAPLVARDAGRIFWDHPRMRASRLRLTRTTPGPGGVRLDKSKAARDARGETGNSTERAESTRARRPPMNGWYRRGLAAA